MRNFLFYRAPADFPLEVISPGLFVVTFLFFRIMPKLSLKDARSFFGQGQYRLSMANYTAILKKLPSKAVKLEEEFLLCFERFRQELSIDNYSIDQINDYFLLFSDVFKFSAKFHVQWANFLLSNGLYEEAALCYMKSLNIRDPTSDLDTSISDAAYSGLKSLKDHLVDQWHFRMLNDRIRNECYDNAIKFAIDHLKKQKSNIRVLDIGSGTALLSMSAVRNGADGQIFAVEKSPLMCQIAEQVLTYNGFGTRVKIIEKHSSELSLLDDLQGEKVDLIVAELMDAGFFGEDILATFLDAKNRFLSDGGFIIPNYVEIFALAIESDEIRDDNLHHSSQQQRPLFDEQFIVTSYLTAKCQSILDCEEPYDSRILKSLKNCRILSKPKEIYRLNINDVEKLTEIVHKSTSFEFDLEIRNSGRVDAIICYFVVKLLDDINISSSPENGSCWEQAVFPICGDFAENLDHVILTATISDNRFEIRLKKPRLMEPNIVICNSNTLRCLNDEVSRSCYRKFFENFPDDFRLILDVSSNPLILEECRKILRNAKITSFNDDFIDEYSKKLAGELDVDFMAAKDIIFDGYFHVILIDTVDEFGLLKLNILDTIFHYREKFKPRRISPNILRIYARLIESSEIACYSKVTCDDRTLNFNIKDAINLFRVETFRDIEFSTLCHINLSDDSQIFGLNFEESCGANQNSNTEFKVKCSGKIDAILYWFEISDSSCPEIAIKTIDSTNRYKQALFILESPVNVEIGNIVILESLLEKSELSFSVEIRK